MFATFTAVILRNRVVAMVALFAVVFTTAAGVFQLGTDFSVQSFFGRDDPETAYLDDYIARWGEDDLLHVVADGGEVGLLHRARLEALDAVVGQLEAVDGVERVLAVTRVPRVNRAVAGMWVPVPLLATAPRDGAPPERMAAWREGLLNDAQIVPSYLSRDGRYSSMMLALGIDTSDLAEVRPVLLEVQRVLNEVDVGDVRFHLGGVPAIRASVLDVIVRDQVVFVPMAGLLMGLMLLLLFRSRHGVIIPGLAAAVPLVMLLGTMGWTGESFGLLNQVLLALVPAIAVADAIHLVSRFHEESRARHDGVGPMDAAARDAAIIEAMKHMGVACFLTTFTTMVGFLALLQTDLPVLQGFGIYAAVGVGLAYFTVLFIVPLALLATRSGARRLDHGAEGVLGRTLDFAVRATTGRPWTTLGVAAVVIAVAIYGGTLVVVDTQVTRTFDDDHPTSVANRLIDNQLGGVLALEFDLSGPAGAFTDPAVLGALAEAEADVMGADGVRATWSVARLLRTASVLVGGPDRVPADPKLIRRLLDLGADDALRATLISEDASRARLLIRTVDVGAVAFLGLGERVRDVLGDRLAGHEVSAHLTGSSYVAYRGMSRVTVDVRNSLFTAFLVIGVIIAVLFRDLWLGVLSLIPNALPLVFGFGVMGWLGWVLEPAPAVVFTIAVGVSVDSAIHVIARFREERIAGKDADAAVRAAVLHSGRAVLITGFILVVGFAVNIQSSSPANASFGKLGTLIIVSALISNLFVLPAMLKVGMAGGSVRRGRESAAS